MTDRLKIYIDRLKNGEVEPLHTSISSNILDVYEKELSFSETIHLDGEAYTTDDHLILHLKVKVDAFLSCSICNSATRVPLQLDDCYHAEPLDQLRSAVFDYTELLREMILIALPDFAECHEGKCPERAGVAQFLKGSVQKKSSKEEAYFPFADLSNDL